MFDRSAKDNRVPCSFMCSYTLCLVSMGLKKETVYHKTFNDWCYIPAVISALKTSLDLSLTMYKKLKLDISKHFFSKFCKLSVHGSHISQLRTKWNKCLKYRLISGCGSLVRDDDCCWLNRFVLRHYLSRYFVFCDDIWPLLGVFNYERTQTSKYLDSKILLLVYPAHFLLFITIIPFRYCIIIFVSTFVIKEYTYQFYPVVLVVKSQSFHKVNPEDKLYMLDDKYLGSRFNHAIAYYQ